MRTEQAIKERLQAELDILGASQGHLQSIARGWVDALEWVLGRAE